MRAAFPYAVDCERKVYSCKGHWRDPEFCDGDLLGYSFEEVCFSEVRKEITRKLACKVDYRLCYRLCRHIAANQILWDPSHPPEHLGVIRYSLDSDSARRPIAQQRGTRRGSSYPLALVRQCGENRLIRAPPERRLLWPNRRTTPPSTVMPPSTWRPSSRAARS